MTEKASSRATGTSRARASRKTVTKTASETNKTSTTRTKKISPTFTPPATLTELPIAAPANWAPIGRIPVCEVQPVLEDGRWPVKAVEHEAFPVSATIFREGHDAYGASAVLYKPDGSVHQRVSMYEVGAGLDRFSGWLCPDTPGDWTFSIEGWSDPYRTWEHEANIKLKAGIDIELIIAQGLLIIKRAQTELALPKAEKSLLKLALQDLKNKTLDAPARLAKALSWQMHQLFHIFPLRDLVSSSPRYPLRVDRERALVGSWYEMFPRSVGAKQKADGTWISGNLRTAAKDLDRIAQMGFDVVYLPPIHPIGFAHRKGKNNSIGAGADQPGSPWAIGAQTGGHDTIHPDLGSFTDFRYFVRKAKKLGLEVALDLALQCSPDHPWVQEHPQWFSTRPDGSIAYAENPPKKYQDIYPLNFDNDPEGILHAVLDVIELWIAQGVTIFRVDNPHTKPVLFWQRLLEEIYKRHPEIIFLAEAFTRPAMMRTLGAVGFHQNYSYFPWRNHKAEITDYWNEVAYQTAHTLRPAFWPTTPDILTPFMSQGGAPAFAIKAVIAATGAPTWGIYSGYELAESVPRPGYEEQNDNEKYEYRPRNFALGENIGISQLLTSINAAKKKHLALRRLRNITFHQTTDESLICYSRTTRPEESPDGTVDTVIVVVNLDPFATREGQIFLDLSKLGVSLPSGWTYGQPAILVYDEISGESYEWNERPYICISPHGRTAHVLAVKPLDKS